MGAERPRNDKIFTRSAEQNRVGGEIGEAPPAADEANRFRGSAPIGGCDSGRESAGTTGGQENPAPTHNMWAFAAGDRKGGPYGSITRGACIVGRRGEGTPPYGCMAGSAVGRATARVAPTGGQGVRDGGPMWASAPTGRSKGAVERVVDDADPYGAQQGGGGGAGRRGR